MMNNKTLVKVSASEGAFSFRTISRSFRSPHRFYILKRELTELAERKHILSMDIHSFARLSLHEPIDEEPMLEITFYWLRESSGNILSGQTETIRLPYKPFYEYTLTEASMDNKEWSMLSLPLRNKPKIEFKSSRNLKIVANNPFVRNKLGRFLSKSFHWVDYQRIILTDDFMPYSFLFTGYTSYGKGICGGVILHQNNPDDVKIAHYSIHT